MAGGSIRRNGSGYRDDTAFQAICNVTKEEKRAKRDRHNKNNRTVVHSDIDRFLDCDNSDRTRHAVELIGVNRGAYQML